MTAPAPSPSSFALRAAVVAAGSLAYIAAFFVLHPTMVAVGSLITIPVVLAGGAFGFRTGLAAGLLAFPANTLLYNVIEGGGGWTIVVDQGGAPGMLALIFVGAVVGALRDLRERAATELQLRIEAERELLEATLQLVHSGRLAALGEMAASVAHELNQPLNAIKLISQSQIKYGDLPADTHDDMTEIVEIVQTMAEIVDHLRVFARREEVEPRSLDVNAVVEGAIKLVGASVEAHEIQLVVEKAEDLPAMVGDLVRLEQVLVNLINNARDSLDTVDGGEKRIEVRTRAARADELGGRAAVVISVADNGVGIAEEDEERIFEPFVTTKDKATGTGLGLSISKKIVEHHDGILALERRATGVRFLMVLPAG